VREREKGGGEASDAFSGRRRVFTLNPPPSLPLFPFLFPGDVNKITVGDDTNIQDCAVLHAAKHNPAGAALPTQIGKNVTIGHGAIIHACRVADGAFVGMGAVVLDGAVVESGAIVAAGAVVPPGAVVPAGQVWAGAPARKVRSTAPGEADFIAASAANNAALAAAHAAENGKDAAELAADAAARTDARERSADYDSHLGVARDPETRAVV
jgi:carbonic anhydrase/acetyltransferase-like protein (isoleucine patch superfamily)